MARILCIGDPHLKITRFDLACQFLSWIDDVIASTKPDIVVNLGDTFDNHAVIRSEIMSKFRDHVLKTTAIPNINYFYILGNHDMYKPTDSTYHALQSLKGINKFTVVDEVLHVGKFTFVPYLPDHTKFPMDTNEICFAHQTFVGADYGYIRPEVGVLAENVAAAIIISGHIHMRQEFGKVIYPGSPYSQNANDVNEIKGVMLFDSLTYKRQYIDCPLPMWRKLSYEITSNFTINDVHQNIINNIDNKNHFILDIMGPKAEVLSYLDSKHFKVIKKGIDLTVKPIFTDKEKKLVKIEAISIEKIMDEYIDNVYKGSLDKKELKTRAIEIIEQVNQSGKSIS